MFERRMRAICSLSVSVGESQRPALGALECLTLGFDRAIRVEILDQQNLMFLLMLEVVPLLVFVESRIQDFSCMVAPNVVGCDKVAMVDGAPVTDRQGPILHGVEQRTPNAWDYLSARNPRYC